MIGEAKLKREVIIKGFRAMGWKKTDKVFTIAGVKDQPNLAGLIWGIGLGLGLTLYWGTSKNKLIKGGRNL